MEINFETFLQHETGLNTLGPRYTHSPSEKWKKCSRRCCSFRSWLSIGMEYIWEIYMRARKQEWVTRSLFLFSPAPPLLRWYNQTTALTVAEFSFNLFTAVRARLSREGWKISSTAASHCCCAREWISKPRSGAVGGTLRKISSTYTIHWSDASDDQRSGWQ